MGNNFTRKKDKDVCVECCVNTLCDFSCKRRCMKARKNRGSVCAKGIKGKQENEEQIEG